MPRIHDRELREHRSYIFWQKREHGKCETGHHVHYRIRLPYWIEVRCKLCKKMHVESYEESTLKQPEEVNAA